MSSSPAKESEWFQDMICWLANLKIKGYLVPDRS